jgi:hypothetical protein
VECLFSKAPEAQRERQRLLCVLDWERAGLWPAHGGRRCVDWRRGALGAAMHAQQPKLCGPGAVPEAHHALPTAHRCSRKPAVSPHRAANLEKCCLSTEEVCGTYRLNGSVRKIRNISRDD